jgi:hypothetical protein
MRKQIFTRIRKTLAVLMLVSLIMFLTAASASAVPYKSTSSYQRGYQAGAQDSYNDGYNDGKDDCLKYGRIGALKKIRAPVVSDHWNKNYKRGFRAGYNNRYLIGYHYGRYGCLKKNSSCWTPVRRCGELLKSKQMSLNFNSKS